MSKLSKMSNKEFYDAQNLYKNRQEAIRILGEKVHDAMSSLATNTVDSGLFLIRPPLPIKEVLMAMFRNELSIIVYFQLREFPLSPLAIRFLFGLGYG